MIPLVGLMILTTGFDYRFFASQGGLLSISLAELVAYVSAFFLGLELILRWRGGGGRYLTFRDPSPWLVGVYAAWCVVCATAVFLLRGSLDGLHYLKDVTPGLVLYTAMLVWVRTRTDMDRIVAYARAMLLGLALLAIAQGVTGGPYINPVDENAYYKLRVSGEEKVDNPVVGTLGSPNAFAVFYGPPMLLALTYRSFLLRHFSLGGLAARITFGLILIAALFLTQAKMAGGIALLALLGWTTARLARIAPSRRALAWGISLLFVASVIIIVVLGVFESSLPPGLTLANLRGRLGLAVEAVRLLGQDTIVAAFGGGTELFQGAVPVLFGVHNEYLHQGLMWGLVGSTLYTVLLVRGLLRSAELEWSAAIPLGVAGTVFLVESAGGNQLQSVVFLLLGFTDVLWRIRGREQAGTPTASPAAGS